MFLYEQIINSFGTGKLKHEITQQNHGQMNNPDNVKLFNDYHYIIMVIVCIVLIFQSKTLLPTVDQWNEGILYAD